MYYLIMFWFYISKAFKKVSIIHFKFKAKEMFLYLFPHAILNSEKFKDY